MGSESRESGAVALVFLAVFAWGCDGPKLSQTPSTLEVSAEALDYGLVALGAEVRKPLKLRNVGRTPLSVASVAAAAPFAVRGFPAEGMTLAAGEERGFEVAFAPADEGRAEAVLELHSDADTDLLELPLSGEGVDAFVSFAGELIDFGEVVLGTTKQLEFQLDNATQLEVAVRLRLDGIDAAEFSASAASDGAAVVVAAGQRRKVAVTFAPVHLGTGEATLLVSPCLGCAEVPVPLRGEGIATCLAAVPGEIDFGTVDVGRQLSRTLEVLNTGNSTVSVSEVFLASSSSSEFRVEGFVAGSARQLAPEGSMLLTVFFSPTALGARAAALRVRAAEGEHECWSEVRLSGAGGSGCLVLAPEAVDFGTVASGMTGRQTVFASNTGCGSDIWIERLEISGDPEIGAATLRPTPFLLAQGEVAEIAASFSPAQPGSYRATLHVEASDDRHRPLSSPPGDVPLTGSARALAPCDFALSPPRLDFGTLEVGARAQLAFKLVNRGQDACYFSNLGLSANSSTAFGVEGASPGFMLAAGEVWDVAVEFSPDAVGTYVGALELYVSDSANPYRSYAISGRSARGCLSIQPRDLDFGLVFASCPPPALTSVVRNSCSSPVQLQSVVRGGGTSSELTLPDLPQLPLTLEPGASLSLQVRYTPIDEGLDSMPIFLNDGTNDHLISAHGSGVVDPLRTDSFDQSVQEMVDVLFVLDNSGSMADKQAAVGANLTAFVRAAIAQNVDYRLAVTTTGIEPSTGGWTTCPGGADGGEAGRLFPADGSRPRVLTTFTSDPETLWAANTAVGICHWLEQGFEAAYRALSPPLVDHADDPSTVLPSDGNAGFLRAEAKLVLVFVSDEDDQSPGTVDFYLDFLQGLKPDPTKLSVSVIVSPEDLSTCTAATTSGTRYMELASRTGGRIESICTPDWGASLDRLGSDAFGAQSVFPLSAQPADPSQIVVLVNGAPATGWSYDRDANAIVFVRDAVPPAGSHIEVTYPLGCP